MTAAMEHEMQRCREAFAHFEYFGGRSVMGDITKTTNRRCHDAYVDFLRHLYEFYVACFKRDRRDLADIDHEHVELLINDTVERLLAAKVDDIEHGRATAEGNQASVYRVAVPREFGCQFRRIRNANSHVSCKRIQPQEDWSSLEFFNRCHLFVHLLYQSALYSWGGCDLVTDMGVIDRFTLAPRQPWGSA